MTVKVSVPSVLWDRTKEWNMEVEGSTVGEVIEELNARYPGFKSDILVDNKVRVSLAVFVNSDDIRHTGGLNTPTPDGTKINIIRAIAGG
jgi:molybdopterin converting factor small subunit